MLLLCAEAQAVVGEGDEAGDNEATTQGIFQQLLPVPSEAPAVQSLVSLATYF